MNCCFVPPPPGKSPIGSDDQFQYVPPTSASPGAPLTDLPTVTKVSMSTGGSGGTTVIITGTNFTGATQVSFYTTDPTQGNPNTQSATSFTVNSATQITAVAPTMNMNPGSRVSVTVQTPAGNSTPSTAASFVLAANGSGSGSGGINVTPPSLPSGGVSKPALNGPFAPHFASIPFVPSSGSGDGLEGTPTTATSINSWNSATNNTVYYHHGSGSGGGGGGASGSYLHSDNWGYHYQMTVRLGGQIIYSYTANWGGDYSSSAVFGGGDPTWQTSETSWSNDSWFENIVTSTSSGTKGSNYNATTTAYKASGHDQTTSFYQEHGGVGPSGSTESGTSAYTGTGTSMRSNASHGNGSYAITGGHSTGQWQAGSTAHNNYTNTRQGALGSDGIWVSSGSMSNGGYGTSYSSLSSKYGYTLTNSTSTRAGSTTGSGSYSAKESGGWSYHDKDTYGPAGITYKSSGQTSHSAGTSNSTTRTKGNSHSTTADGRSNSNWSHTYRGNGSNSYNGTATLGSDGIWQSSGSMSTTWSGKGKGADSDIASFDTHSASGSSSTTGAGDSTSTSTSASSSSSSAASKMTNGAWTPVSGQQFYSNNGKAKDSMSDGGTEKSVVVGDKLTGPWSVSDSGNSNYTFTQKSVLGAGGKWTTTGTAAQSGSGNGNDSANESGTESLESTGLGQGVGSLSIKESDIGKSKETYHAKQTMTQGGGWVSVSGSATSTSGSTSKSTDTGGGNSSSATAVGDSNDDWSDKDNETAKFSGQLNTKLGSDGVWITTGSVTISGSGSGKDSYSDKGKESVSGDDISSSSGSSSLSDHSGSNKGWETGSDNSTSSSGSTSSIAFNAKYSLDSNGNWDPVSGSAVATITASAHDSMMGEGDFGFALAGGSDIGTWSAGGNDHSSTTAVINSTLDSNGDWTSTGSDTGSGGGSWSSGFGDDGLYGIDTGSVSSGNWDNETGTLTESGGDNGGYSDNYSFSLAPSGSWQGNSGSTAANETDTDDFSDDETDNYGEDTSGGEVIGSKTDDDAIDITATANADWTLGSSGIFVLSSSSSNVTETINDSDPDSFSGGDPVTGSVQGSLQETLSSSNGGTLTVIALTETASGSFSDDGTQASFNVNVGGSSSAPTTTITETNTADLNDLSTINVDDADALENAIVTAIATGNNSSPAMYSSSWTYNSAGDLVNATLTDGNGDTTAWTFNTAGQLTSRTLAYDTAEAATTTFGYDAKGNLISVTDPDGNVTTYTYNDQGQETAMTDPLGNVQTMEYNSQGQLMEQINRDGMYETYDYNSAGKMVQESWYAADGTETDQLNFDYNIAGQLVSANNDEGTYTFTYNDQGQVIGVTEPFGVSLTFAYDSNGNRVEVQDSLGGTLQSSYDAENQLASELFSESGHPTLGIDESYNSDCSLANVTYYNGTSVVATTDYVYDDYGDVTSIVQTNGGGDILGDYTYNYDTNYESSGTNLPGLTLPSSTPSGTAAILAAFLEPPQLSSSVASETDNAVTANYAYDGSGELVSYGSTTQSYDLNGNRNGSGYEIGPDDQLLSDGTYNYTYDADGNEATKTNIATGDKWTYGYNNADQLVSAVETTASGTVETQVVIKYDVFGNRLEEDVWIASAGWTTTRFAYDAWDRATPSGVGNENWKVWATLDGNNNLATRYINGDALDQVFAQISAGGAVAWYLTDRLSSTRALVDNNGNLLDAITYDAWGNMTSQTNASAQPLLMFTGIAYDSTLGLYFNGNGGREYDPETERFIEQDLMQFAAGDSNLYRYVLNDPTNAVDPSGLASIRPVVLENGKILLYYMAAGPGRPVFGKYTGKVIGVLDPATNLVTRGGYSVDLATVEGEVNSWWTTSDWDSWFKENAADLTPYNGKNLSIGMGAWQSSRNDIAQGVQISKGLVKELMLFYTFAGSYVSSSRSALALSNWAKAGKNSSLPKSLTSRSKWSHVPAPESLQGIAWQQEGVDLLKAFDGEIKFIDKAATFRGKPQFGGYDPVTNTITLYRGSDDVTLFEELLHWRDLQQRMERMGWDRAKVAEFWADPVRRQQLYDAMEQFAVRDLQRFGFRR